jgi:hypothetical protein
MTLLIILAFLSLYLTNGVRVARNRYALELHAANNRDIQAEIASLNQQMNNHRHDNSCWRGPTYRDKNRKCDCRSTTNRKIFNELYERHESLVQESLGRPAITSPYKTIFIYPVLSLDSYLRGKDLKKPNYSYIAAREVELLELEK